MGLRKEERLVVFKTGGWSQQEREVFYDMVVGWLYVVEEQDFCTVRTNLQ